MPGVFILLSIIMAVMEIDASTTTSAGVPVNGGVPVQVSHELCCIGAYTSCAAYVGDVKATYEYAYADSLRLLANHSLKTGVTIASICDGNAAAITFVAQITKALSVFALTSILDLDAATMAVAIPLAAATLGTTNTTAFPTADDLAVVVLEDGRAPDSKTVFYSLMGVAVFLCLLLVSVYGWLQCPEQEAPGAQEKEEDKDSGTASSRCQDGTTSQLQPMLEPGLPVAKPGGKVLPQEEVLMDVIEVVAEHPSIQIPGKQCC